MDGSATLTFPQLFLLGMGPATIAALVAILTPLVSGYWHEQAEKRKRKADKFEDLVAVLFEHKHWIDRAQNAYVFDKYELEATPMARVFAIANTYFPQFNDDIRSMDIAADKYMLALMEAGKKRLSGEKSFFEGVGEIYRDYIDAHHRLLTRLREFARRQFQ